MRYNEVDESLKNEIVEEYLSGISIMKLHEKYGPCKKSIAMMKFIKSNPRIILMNTGQMNLIVLKNFIFWAFLPQMGVIKKKEIILLLNYKKATKKFQKKLKNYQIVTDLFIQGKIKVIVEKLFQIMLL